MALVHADPEGPGVEVGWLSEVLPRACAGYHVPRSDDPDWVRAWSVGGVQNGETLVQSRPVVRDPRADFVADFLRATSQTTLATYFAARDDGAESLAVPRLGLARFQRWIGVRAEGDLTAGEDPAAARERLTRALPDFLVRSLGQHGDRELSVFAFLAVLHAQGDMSKPLVAPPQIRRALAALDEQLGRPPRINLFVSDGRSVGVLHRGGRLLMVEPPPPSRAVRAIAQAAAPRTASLLVFDPEAGELPAGSTARRLAEGIFTLHVRQPGQIERE